MADLEAELDAFIAADRTRPGPHCWMCSIPERAAIEARFKAGVPQATLQRFLQSRHKDVSRNRMMNHFRSGHHEQA